MARLPRRVKRAWHTSARTRRQRRQLRHWKLVRRYYLRLSAAVKRQEERRAP